MPIYEVQTNTDHYYTNATSRTLQAAMFRYLRLWRNAGNSYASAKFVFGRVGFVSAQAMTRKYKERL